MSATEKLTIELSPEAAKAIRTWGGLLGLAPGKVIEDLLLGDTYLEAVQDRQAWHFHDLVAVFTWTQGEARAIAKRATDFYGVEFSAIESDSEPGRWVVCSVLDIRKEDER